MPQNEWLYSYLLGYDSELEVISAAPGKRKNCWSGQKNSENYKADRVFFDRVSHSFGEELGQLSRQFRKLQNGSC